jgi:hypothetical protein
MGEKRHRVQLDFSDSAYHELHDLKKEAHVKTNAEIVRNALKVYAWMIEQKRKEKRIIIMDRKGEAKEVEFVF